MLDLVITLAGILVAVAVATLLTWAGVRLVGKAADRFDLRRDPPGHLDQDESEVEAQPSSAAMTTVQPVVGPAIWAGVGLSTLGAICILVGTFLPAIEPPAEITSVQSNTLIQGGDWPWVMYAALIIGLAMLAVRKPNASGSVVLLGLLGIAYAIYSGTGDRVMLESLAGSMTTMGSAGTGIYAVGVGSAMALVGGGIMVFSDAQQEGSPSMKTCPDCAELILVDARVCKHCGYRFEQVAPA